MWTPGAPPTLVIKVELESEADATTRRELADFKRDLKLIPLIKARADELGINSATVSRLIADHIGDLGALLENLHEHTFAAFAECTGPSR